MKMLTYSAAAILLATAATAETSLTIYNQAFGVVRDIVPLDLKPGVNQVRFRGVTAHLEPDSVILRDPKEAVQFTILEQNYRADPVTSGLLLDLYTGKEIEFLVREAGQPERTTKGRVVRSGYDRNGGASQPVIDVGGKLRFSLPGEPIFPSLADDTILEPTLDWRIHSDKAVKLDAEIGYVTGGVNWDADYNLVAPERGDVMDFSGWVTIRNHSGKLFKDARIELMAGDVAKVKEASGSGLAAQAFADRATPRAAPKVTEKALDEFHLYSLPLPVTLHDRETKQVEFVRAAGVKAARSYIFDGSAAPEYINRGGGSRAMQASQSGSSGNTKVWIMREIRNSKDNRLGLPLPFGRMRFYRRDDDGVLQFIGEDVIDHTPQDETLRLYTGNAFDLVGERKQFQTNTQTDDKAGWSDTSFEIVLRNRKRDESVEINVIEHLDVPANWEIRDNSAEFRKLDGQTIEFTVSVKPGEQRVLKYTAHYFWAVQKPQEPSPADPFGPAPLKTSR